MPNYIAITPARDEERLLPGLIDSMLAQSQLPARWVIVDDGSTDATPTIIGRAARRNPWIEGHHLERTRRAEGGESAVTNFMSPSFCGHYDYLLRLDADLTFGEDFVAKLLDEFVRDPELGIAGATLYEPDGSSWREIRTPRFHTRGAVKMYSAACLRAIGGIDAGLGWDTLDEAQAMMLGFRTRGFEHIVAYHHRPQGAAGGRWRGRLASGRAAYRSGYSPSFMLVRAAAHLLKPPYLAGGAVMFGGFLEGYLRRKPRAASPELMKFVRHQQRRRLMMMDSLWQ